MPGAACAVAAVPVVPEWCPSAHMHGQAPGRKAQEILVFNASPQAPHTALSLQRPLPILVEVPEFPFSHSIACRSHCPRCPQDFILRLMWFGAVYYCQVVPLPPPKRARGADPDTEPVPAQATASILTMRAAGVKRFGNNVSGTHPIGYQDAGCLLPAQHTGTRHEAQSTCRLTDGQTRALLVYYAWRAVYFVQIACSRKVQRFRPSTCHAIPALIPLKSLVIFSHSSCASVITA